MKTLILLCLSITLFHLPLHAGTIVTPGRISVQGRLEGDQGRGTTIGETIDYLTFEVITRTAVRLIGTDINSSVFLAMAEVFPGGELTNAGQPYRLFYNSTPPVPQLTLVLDPGLFAVQIAVEEYSDGDLGDSFVPVENSDAIISTVSYSFVLEGDIRGLEFMEGNRDRTFTVTTVPEPTVAALLLTAFAAGFIRRVRQKGGKGS